MNKNKRNVLIVNIIWIVFGILMAVNYYDINSKSIITQNQSCAESLSHIIAMKYYFSFNYIAVGIMLIALINCNKIIFKVIKVILIIISGMPIAFFLIAVIWQKECYHTSNMEVYSFIILFILQIIFQRRWFNFEAKSCTGAVPRIILIGLSVIIVTFQIMNAVAYIRNSPPNIYSQQLWNKVK